MKDNEIITEEIKMGYIYILFLKDYRFYIGWSENNPKNRIDQHFQGCGSTWTRKYPPKSFKIIENQIKSDEEKWTLQYMADFGIDYVRGGAFCSMTLKKSDRRVLEKIVSSIQNKCYYCGDSRHFSNLCGKKRKREEELLEQIEAEKYIYENEMEISRVVIEHLQDKVTEAHHIIDEIQKIISVPYKN